MHIQQPFHFACSCYPTARHYYHRPHPQSQHCCSSPQRITETKTHSRHYICLIVHNWLIAIAIYVFPAAVLSFPLSSERFSSPSLLTFVSISFLVLPTSTSKHSPLFCIVIRYTVYFVYIERSAAYLSNTRIFHHFTAPPVRYILALHTLFETG